MAAAQSRASDLGALCRAKPEPMGGQACGLPHGVFQPVLQPLRYPADVAALLDKPNNNLAVEYCKAIIEQNVEMQPIALPRQGSCHAWPLWKGSYSAMMPANFMELLLFAKRLLNLYRVYRKILSFPGFVGRMYKNLVHKFYRFARVAA